MNSGYKSSMGRFPYLCFLLSFTLIVSLTYNTACKNPQDWQPPFDSLYPPPEAPQLISPKNDTTFWYQTPFPHEVILKWSLVDGTEYYELQIARDSLILPDVDPIRVDAALVNHTLERTGYYFWRVRAYSRKWTWYTDWSKTWHFAAWYAP